jgi:uncharacterized membrane protein YphA (DoxX/SURF4 family)
MTTNLSPNYAHWAAGAAFVLAAISYLASWSVAGALALAIGVVFELAAWTLLAMRDEDDG